jgi:transposase-like protein
MTARDFAMVLPQSASPLRDPKRRRRPYRPEVVEAVRALLGTGLRFAEIAAQTGVGEATVGRWSRRFRFGAGEGGSADLAPVSSPAAAEQPEWGTRTRMGEERRPGRYPPETREAARALVEGTRLGLERIGLELGIGPATLSRWVRRCRWQRPATAAHARPARYRVPRGRPYAGDAVEKVRDLVTGTLLSQKRIAAQAGVSQPTVSIWIRKRGSVRPSPKPWSRRFAASARAAPLAATGSRRGRPYAPETVAAARGWYEQTELSTVIIATRVRVTPVTVARWAKAGGWTRPRDIPNSDGSPARRPRRRHPPRRW